MARLLPPFGSSLNPVDMTPQTAERLHSTEPDLLKKYLHTLLRDQNLHTPVLIFTMTVGKRAVKVAEDIVDTFRETKKPMTVLWLARLRGFNSLDKRFYFFSSKISGGRRFYRGLNGL